MKTKALLVSLAILVASWFPIITFLAVLAISAVLWLRLARELYELDSKIIPPNGSFDIVYYQIIAPYIVVEKLFYMVFHKDYREDVIKHYKTKLKFPV